MYQVHYHGRPQLMTQDFGEVQQWCRGDGINVCDIVIVEQRGDDSYLTDDFYLIDTDVVALTSHGGPTMVWSEPRLATIPEIIKRIGPYMTEQEWDEHERAMHFNRVCDPDGVLFKVMTGHDASWTADDMTVENVQFVKQELGMKIIHRREA